KAEIVEIVDSIIDNRMRDGQLDEANLTLKDISVTRDIFVEMLQAVFHPRINYPSLPSPVAKRATAELVPEVAAPLREDIEAIESISRAEAGERATIEHEPVRVTKTQTIEIPTIKPDDDTPMPEVPPLRRTQRMNPVEEKSLEEKPVEAKSEKPEDR
ncbi:MAG: hypothetical protein ABI700_28055, partial [Chloroflexota bacterium]